MLWKGNYVNLQLHIFILGLSLDIGTTPKVILCMKQAALTLFLYF